MHLYNSLEKICYDILESICLDVSEIERFSTAEGCVTNIEKQVIKQLRDRNYNYAMNIYLYVLGKVQPILQCASTVLLEDPEYENFIGVVSILKGTYFTKVDFIIHFNGLLSSTTHFWIFRKNDKRVQCNGHRDGKKQ